MYVKFQLSSSNSFQDMRGPKFTLGALRLSDALLRKYFHTQKQYVTLSIRRSQILRWGVKISTQTSPSFLGSKFTHFLALTQEEGLP